MPKSVIFKSRHESLLPVVVQHKKKTMWIEFIKNFSNDCQFKPPAEINDINKAEKELGISLHEDLKAVLLESNGIEGEYGLGLLWTVDRIKSDNMTFRTNADFKDLYMTFDSLLFFGDAGNGDQFAYPIQNGQIHNNDIFVWNHEDDSRSWIAPNLNRYFEWWLTGKIKI